MRYARRIGAAAVTLLVLLTAEAPAQLLGTQERRWSDAGQSVVSPDGRHLYAAGWWTLSFARNQETGGLTLISDIEPGAESGRIAISPDGGDVYVGGLRGLHVMSRDAATGLLTYQETYLGQDDPRYDLSNVSGIVVTPDGKQVAVISQDDNAMFVFARDRASHRLTFESSHAAPALGLAVAPDGSALLAVGQEELAIFPRDQATGRVGPARRYPDPPGKWTVAVTPDGRTVVTAGGSNAFGVFARDPVTGGLGPAQTLRFNDDAFQFLPATMAATDGSFYGVGDAKVRQGRLDPEGATLVREYPDGVDGTTGLKGAAAISLSPDGRSAYVTGRGPRRESAGIIPSTIVRFTRDPASGDLRFAEALRPPQRTFPVIPTRPTATVNGGAVYTNDREVTVTYDGTAASVRLGEEGGALGPAVRASADGTYRMLLSPGLPGRSVRRVQVVATGSPDRERIVATDDIILDQRRPTVESAVIVESVAQASSANTSVATAAAAPQQVLRLRARDGRSGVKGLQLTRDRSRPGAVRAYKPKLTVQADQRRRWVRVRDGAGNWSRWRAVKRAASPSS